MPINRTSPAHDYPLKSKRQKSKAILEYMQAGIFKSRMILAIDKSVEAYNLIIDEIKQHNSTWKKRYDIYSIIHANVQAVRIDIGKIITGGGNVLIEKK